MRRFVVAAAMGVACAWPVVAQAQITFGNNCTQDEAPGDTTTECTITGVQAGAAIVACAIANGLNPGGGFSFSDDKSSSYSSAFTRQKDMDLVEASISYATGVTGGDTVVTMTLSTGADQWRRMFAIEVRGVTTVSPLDDSDYGEGTGTSAALQAALTASQSGVSLACLQAYVADTITEGGGYTLIAEDETFVNVSGSFVRQVTSAGSYTPSWTIGSSDRWVAVGINLKASASAAAPCSLMRVGRCF